MKTILLTPVLYILQKSAIGGGEGVQFWVSKSKKQSVVDWYTYYLDKVLNVTHEKNLKTQPFLPSKAASCVSKVTGANPPPTFKKTVKMSICADPMFTSFVNLIKWDFKILRNKQLLLLY